jgi:hypothetical protein
VLVLIFCDVKCYNIYDVTLRRVYVFYRSVARIFQNHYEDRVIQVDILDQSHLLTYYTVSHGFIKIGFIFPVKTRIRKIFGHRTPCRFVPSRSVI